MKYILKILLVVALISLLASCNSQKDTGKEITLRLEPSSGNPRNSEGDFVRLKDGRILFVYSHFTGGSGDNSSAYLAGRYSSDEGKTWSDKDVIILSNEGGMNVMSVSLIRLDENRIALFYLRKNSETDCIPLMRISNDEAETWSDAKECITDVPGYYVMNNDRVVKLKNGRIILPLSLHNTPDSDGWFNGRLICYYSDDDGETWLKGGEVANPNNVTSQEPGLIELNDGRLMQFCRTDAGVQYVSISNDHGESWSELRPGNIKSPLSPASVERIPQTDDLLLVWNNNYEDSRDGGRRTPFNLAISKDEGVTWEKVKTIESDPNGWYCYTAIEFVGDHVLLGHCAGDTKNYGGLETTQITRLSLDWIYKDATQEPVVLSDKGGTVELKCEDENAKIYYTINGTYPTIESSKIYNSPIKVNGTTLLQMFAISDDKTVSGLVSTYIGTDIYQPAIDSISITGSGLSYNYLEGEIKNTGGIDKAVMIESGVMPKFSIEDRKKEMNFAYTFDGIIKIPQDDLFTFYLKSNDGSVLYIDDRKVIDNDGLHGAYEKSVSISLQRGLHKIALKYFQAGGGKFLQVSWSCNKFEKAEIPEMVLYH